MARIFILFWFLLSLGCQKSQNPSENQPYSPPEGTTLKIDDTSWTVTAKTCDGQGRELWGTERFHFKSGLFAYIYKVSESDSEICHQALAYHRLIQSASASNQGQSEISTLIPQQKRTVCKSRATSQTLSDETLSATGSNEVLKIDFNKGLGQAQFKGATQCPQGILHFELVRK